MFEGLSEKLSGILDRLTRRGALSEADVDVALREVRRALLEADVALDVVRSFVDKVRARAVGANVVKSVTPGQMVIKIVNDVLIETLGADGRSDRSRRAAARRDHDGRPARRRQDDDDREDRQAPHRDAMKRKVLMASLDVKRPAAQEQLAVLGRQVGVDTLPIVAGQTPVQIAKRAEQAARLARLRRRHARHRGPHPYRRRADGRDGRDQGGVAPA